MPCLAKPEVFVFPLGSSEAAMFLLSLWPLDCLCQNYSVLVVFKFLDSLSGLNSQKISRVGPGICILNKSPPSPGNPDPL